MHSCKTLSHIFTHTAERKGNTLPQKKICLNVLSLDMAVWARQCKRAIIVLFRVCSIFMAHSDDPFKHNTVYPRLVSCFIILLANITLPPPHPNQNTHSKHVYMKTGKKIFALKFCLCYFKTVYSFCHVTTSYMQLAPFNPRAQHSLS